MDFLARLKHKAFVIDLSHLPECDRNNLKAVFEAEKEHKKSFELSEEAQNYLEEVVNQIVEDA